MSKRFASNAAMESFLAEPRLGILMYNGPRPAPTGVPVWFHRESNSLQMFAGRTSPKVRYLERDPRVSVLVTNRVGEPEGWVAFDGVVRLSDFSSEDWSELLDHVAPKYWNLNDPGYAGTIDEWRSSPQAFVSITLEPETIRTGS